MFSQTELLSLRQSLGLWDSNTAERLVHNPLSPQRLSAIALRAGGDPMLPTVSVETDTDNTFISSTVLKITCLLLPTEIQLSVCQWSKQSCRVHSFHGLGKQSSHGLSDYRVDLE